MALLPSMSPIYSTSKMCHSKQLTAKPKKVPFQKQTTKSEQPMSTQAGRIRSNLDLSLIWKESENPAAATRAAHAARIMYLSIYLICKLTPNHKSMARSENWNLDEISNLA